MDFSYYNSLARLASLSFNRWDYVGITHLILDSGLVPTEKLTQEIKDKIQKDVDYVRSKHPVKVILAIAADNKQKNIWDLADTVGWSNFLENTSFLASLSPEGLYMDAEKYSKSNDHFPWNGDWSQRAKEWSQAAKTGNSNKKIGHYVTFTDNKIQSNTRNAYIPFFQEVSKEVTNSYMLYEDPYTKGTGWKTAAFSSLYDDIKKTFKGVNPQPGFWLFSDGRYYQNAKVQASRIKDAIKQTKCSGVWFYSNHTTYFDSPPKGPSEIEDVKYIIDVASGRIKK